MSGGKISSWTKVKIGDACRVGDGAHGSLKRYDNGIMYLTSKNFKSDGLDLSKLDYIDEKTYQKYFKENSTALTRPIADDVLFSIIGSIGSPYLVQPHDLFGISSSVAILRPDTSLIFPKYLFYWIKGQTYQDALNGIKGGVAQGYVSLEMIRSLPLYYPSLPTQRKIADVLSAYDDLIEVNVRRIRVLEAMAQSVYREWFGNVDAKSLPKGWRVSRLSEIVENIRETTNAGPHLDDLPYVPIDSLPRHSLVLSESKPGTEAQSSLILFKKNDILFGAMRSYFHKVVVAPFDGVTRSTCFVFRPVSTSIYSYAVLTLFQAETVAYSHAHSRGATMPYAVWGGSFSDMPTIIPPDNLLVKFNDIIKPMLETIQLSYFRQTNLRRTRDLLLPRLVSGEVVLG